MKRHGLFLIVSPLFIMLAFAQSRGQDGGEKMAFTPPAPTIRPPIPPPTIKRPPPACAIARISPTSADTRLVRNGETIRLNIVIVNGPANGSVSPSSGECSSFTNSSGTFQCNTAPLYRPGENTFTLAVGAAEGNIAGVYSSCSTRVYVSCQRYRVWNNTGFTHDFMLHGRCMYGKINGGEITASPTLLVGIGDTIEQYASSSYTGAACSGPVLRTFPYDAAMSYDSLARGGNGDCLVNFPGPDR
jgi:hypothetical protein